MYASEALSFGSLRYQTPYGSGVPLREYAAKKYYHQVPQKKITNPEKDCEICREKKRRSLLEYRRTKSRECDSSIREDEEETCSSQGAKTTCHKK